MRSNDILFETHRLVLFFQTPPPTNTNLCQGGRGEEVTGGNGPAHRLGLPTPALVLLY